MFFWGSVSPHRIPWPWFKEKNHEFPDGPPVPRGFLHRCALIAIVAAAAAEQEAVQPQIGGLERGENTWVY